MLETEEGRKEPIRRTTQVKDLDEEVARNDGADTETTIRYIN
jgi:hypothetical protein